MTTKQATHTAGPWRLDHERVLDADGNVVALICDVYNGANAALISSAPLMLEALEATEVLLRTMEREPCIDCGKGHDVVDHNYGLERIRAAISKARGEV